MQITTGIRSALSLPVVYGLLQTLLGGSSALKEVVAKYVRPSAGDRLLDYGCGPGAIGDYLPASCTVVGYDISDDYVRYAERSGVPNRRFTTNLEVVRGSGPYDIAMAIGLLHHLEDAEAEDCLALMFECLKPGGRLVTLDGVHLEGQGPFARMLIYCDRGKNVRDTEGYLGLFAGLPVQPVATIRSDLLRVPYTHLICELGKARATSGG